METLNAFNLDLQELVVKAVKIALISFKQIYPFENKPSAAKHSFFSYPMK